MAVSLTQSIERTYGSKAAADGIPWIQIEINRKLYLNDACFDQKKLKVNKEIIITLRRNIYNAIIEGFSVRGIKNESIWHFRIT
jgi:N-formylglutamate amidohydrolase